MTHMIKIAFGSKLIHADKIKSFETEGFHFISRWLDTANLSINSTKPAAKWQPENFVDIVASEYFVLYGEKGDVLQGAIGEAFYALAYRIPVYVVMDFSEVIPNPWMLLGDATGMIVRRRGSVPEVLAEIKRSITPPDARMAC